MQHIRLNQGVKRHQKGDELILFLGNQKIMLPNTLGLVDLFYEMLLFQREFTRDLLITEYKLSEKLFELLVKLGVFISLENCSGPESRLFHQLVENPSVAYLLAQGEESFVGYLYDNLEAFFYASLGDLVDKKDAYIPQKLSSEVMLQPTFSIRKLTPSNISSQKEQLLSMIATLCSTEEGKYFYGSGGGFYSIYPVLVFRDDSAFVFDRFNNCFYRQQTSGFYQELCQAFIPTSQNCFELYECHLILLSAYEATLSKYGNRGYKYIQMEAGALSTLIRQYTANLMIPQLEVQGYFDQQVWQLLEKYLGIVKEKTLLIHMMCLN